MNNSIKNISNYSIKDLYKIAYKVRIDCIKMISSIGSGHPGGCLSVTDIITVIYCYFFNGISIEKFNDSKRPRLILSKGHCVPVLYSLYYYFNMISKDDIKSFRKIGTLLQGHPCLTKLPYVESSTGSLGQGLSVAQGMALSYKLDKIDSMIFCVMGDGEIQEGQVWESFMSLGFYKLSNICVIIDHNKSQIDGLVNEVMGIEPLSKKLESFNLNVLIIDGNDIQQIINSINKAKICNDKPTVIIANTIKGKGVSFMENNIDWHGKAPNFEECEKALSELSKHIH